MYRLRVIEYYCAYIYLHACYIHISRAPIHTAVSSLRIPRPVPSLTNLFHLASCSQSPSHPLALSSSPPTCSPSRSLAPLTALARVSTRSWRHPFDRMYFIDEDGHEKPTAESLEALSTIVMFRSGVWFMAIIDMGFKFTIVSFLGVLFQDNQVAGTCVAWLCCASIMAFFAFQRPYVK